MIQRVPIWAENPDELLLIHRWHQHHFPLDSQMMPEAVSQRLSCEWLLTAYPLGLFPWYCADDPVAWWSPNPRMVLFPENFLLHRSFKKVLNARLNSGEWSIYFDRNFSEVVQCCASQFRKGQQGTWITSEVMSAYHQLHLQSHAHSISVYHQDEFVGGLYFVNFGRIVFGESMFAKEKDASKMALYALVELCKQREIVLIDCQQETSHLASLGAEPINKKIFDDLLNKHTKESLPNWPLLGFQIA
jgi:leucyl/phenylalanyl-tRNA--protein transferase